MVVPTCWNILLTVKVRVRGFKHAYEACLVCREDVEHDQDDPDHTRELLPGEVVRFIRVDKTRYNHRWYTVRVMGLWSSTEVYRIGKAVEVSVKRWCLCCPDQSQFIRSSPILCLSLGSLIVLSFKRVPNIWIQLCNERSMTGSSKCRSALRVSELLQSQ